MASSICTDTKNADDVLANLTEGNQHFAKDRQHKIMRERTRKSQHPCAVMVCCSDSRVPSHVVFQVDSIGDIFEVRTAGQALGTSDIESIRYAIEHIRPTPKLVIVMGHRSCGAVAATVSAVVDHDEHLVREYPQIISNLRDSVETVAQKLGPSVDRDRLLFECVRQNVLDKAAHLAQVLQKSLGHADAGESKSKSSHGADRLTVCPAVYDTHTGRVEWLGKIAVQPIKNKKKRSRSRS